jgi:hypothetical protein
LSSRTRFRRYRGRRVSLSYFALPESFSAVPRAWGPNFMFCAQGLIFGGAECVGSRFHVLRSRTHFRRYRGRRVPFSCFALPDSFWAVPKASGPIFMLCAPALVFGGTEGVGYRFHVLRSRTSFRRYRGRGVPISCFVLRDSFSAVPRATGPFFLFCALGIVFGSSEGVGTIFMFCSPGLFFGGTEGIGSRFHVLRSRNRFRWYRVRRVSFSSFALPESFSEVLGALGPFFMFCALGIIFGRAEGVGSRFRVLRSKNRFRRC